MLGKRLYVVKLQEKGEGVRGHDRDHQRGRKEEKHRCKEWILSVILLHFRFREETKNKTNEETNHMKL